MTAVVLKRDVAALKQRTFDVLVIGGGAMGAAIAWDAAQRGLAVALVEADDFGSATSAGSSKLIHGGLRYLNNFELGLVAESLAERRTWRAIAPHQVHERPFVLPLYGAGRLGRLKLGVGLRLYDFLAARAKGPIPEMPRHRWLGPDAARAAAPMLHAAGLDGAFLYYDCATDAPERLCLAMVKAAAREGAVVANHARLLSVLREGDRIVGGRVEDALGGDAFDVRAAVTVNATGPWADHVMADAFGGVAPTRLLRSKGVHILTGTLARTDAAVAVMGRDGHFFLLPWRDDVTIIGTTDTAYDDDPADVSVTEDDIAGLIDTVNAALPDVHLARADIIHAYVGLRPLIEDAPEGAESESYTASRKAEVCDHAAEDGLDGFVSAIGGKWTTSRRTAEAAVDLIAAKLGRAPVACRTAQTPLPGGETSPEAIYDHVRARHDLDAAAALALTRTYGDEADAVLACGGAETLAPGRSELAAEIRHAARAEMACTLEDVVFRRTVLGAAGNPGAAALGRAADLLAEELGWDAARRDHERARVMARFIPEVPA